MSSINRGAEKNWTLTIHKNKQKMNKDLKLCVMFFPDTGPKQWGCSILNWTP